MPKNLKISNGINSAKPVGRRVESFVISKGACMMSEIKRSLYVASEFEKALLELKIYQPYFISRSTVIEYHNDICSKLLPEKLSIMDIL